MEDYLLCVDWGTTNLRAFCVSTNTGEIIASSSSDNGISKVYALWLQTKNTDRQTFFLQFIGELIRELSLEIKGNLNGIPLIISGMVSSRNGLEELPYAPVPFRLNGEDILFKKYKISEDFGHSMWIISGVQCGMDVMRGEEVQMIGMMSLFNERNFTTIFPGTHSKHVQVSDGEMTSFKTFMTGELFQLLSRHGMLSSSIEFNILDNVRKEEAFAEGVKKGITANLLNSLFSVRVNELLKGMDKKENWHFLSGLLIGYEMKELIKSTGPVYLCVGTSLSGLYERASELVGIKKIMRIVSSDMVDQSVVKAHISMYNNIFK